MSGYLQRILSTALDPGRAGAIHPIVGSIYSSESSEPAEGPLLSEPNESGSPERKANDPERLLLKPLTRPQDRGILPFEQPLKIPEKHAPLNAITGRPQATYTAEHRTPEPNSRSSKGEETARTPATFPRQERTIAVHAHKLHGPEEFQRERKASVQSDKLKSALDPNMRLARRRDSETDEIQIHIGRIEVTAVPQAPARAAVTSTKRLSLDEYLKRGDRRG